MKTKNIILTTLTGIALTGLFAFKMIEMKWNTVSKDVKIDFTLPNGKHSGTITGLDATIDFDPSQPNLASIKAVVDVKSLQADNSKLTDHLMTADFFDAANHPQITFTSESVAATDTGFVANGKLAMRDSVHTVSIPFKFIRVEGEERASFKGTLDIFAGDYGVGKKSEKGNDRVVIAIEVPVTK